MQFSTVISYIVTQEVVYIFQKLSSFSVSALVNLT